MNRSITKVLFCMILLHSFWILTAGASTKIQVATFVRDSLLGGSLSGKTLWMTDTSFSPAYLARDPDPDSADVFLPYTNTWVVMIDDFPRANFGHPCRWVFLADDSLSAFTIMDAKQWAPAIFLDTVQMNFSCRDFTSLGADSCTGTAVEGGLMEKNVPEREFGAAADKNCLHAVMISGGWNTDYNYDRYPKNLGRMYQILRKCGFPAANISTYYNNGSGADLDNADGDGDYATGGSEVTGTASQANIKAKIQNLCANLNPKRDVLFIYATNHGIDDKGIALWDFDGDGQFDDDEVITPAELADWTKNCKVCRLFVILDQCYSGEFLGPLSDANHTNSAVYVAANDHEPSWGSEYLDKWDDNDPEKKSMDDMHPATLGGSSPGKSEGKAGNGNSKLCECWELEIDYFPHTYALATLVQYPSGTVLDQFNLTGPTTVAVDLPSLADLDFNGKEEVPTEMTQLQLTGTSGFLGQVTIMLRDSTQSPFRKTIGHIEENANLTPGILNIPPFADSGTASSFFDVFFEVRVNQPPPFDVLHNIQPLHLEATLYHKPCRLGTVFQFPDTVLLYNQLEQPTSFAVTAAHTPYTQQTVHAVLFPDWQMLSNPVGVQNDSAGVLFPSAISHAFLFEGSYVVTPTIPNGRGVWMKFESPGTAALTGDWIDALDIPVNPGWNMIGSISDTVPTSSITTSPAGIVASQYFGYNGAYMVASTIDPAKSYWVNANSSGTLHLATGGSAAVPGNGAGALTEMNAITVIDAAGRRQSLYIGDDAVLQAPLSSYALPPGAPESKFDVRFASGRMVEVYRHNMTRPERFPIHVAASAYPLTIGWKLKPGLAKQLILSGDRANASLAPVELTGEGTLQITDASVSVLSLLVQDRGTVPASFALYQSYPNPFNPTALIDFDVPLASTVTVTVFDVLGQEVARLIDDAPFAAGTYTTRFDARNYGSGVYYYRMTAVAGDRTFTDTKKMILVR